MSRARRDGYNVRESVLSYNDASAAKHKLAAWQRTMTALHIVPSFSYAEMLGMVFKFDHIRIAKEAFHVVDAPSPYDTYKTNANMSLTLQFREAHMAAINEDHFDQLPLFGAGPLGRMVADIIAIDVRFQNARKALDYLNTTTPAAFRYYFPSIMSMVASKAIPTELPSRYAHPHDIAEYLPIIREASVLVAECLLMPEPTTYASKHQATFRFNSDADRMFALFPIA